MGNSQIGVPGPGEQTISRSNSGNSSFDVGSTVAKRAGMFQEESIHSTLDRRRAERSRKRPLRVMKFGGTSVADASCIEKVVEIIREASCECNVVVVVSAMSGVTNKLIERSEERRVGKECRSGW